MTALPVTVILDGEGICHRIRLEGYSDSFGSTVDGGVRKWLKVLDGPGTALAAAGPQPAGWSFGKYVVDQDGKVIAFFPSPVTPDAPDLCAAIEKALVQ